MNKEEAKQYTRKQSEDLVNAVISADGLGAVATTAIRIAQLIDREQIVDRTYFYLSNGLDKYYETHKQRTKELLDEDSTAAIALQIFEIGEIRRKNKADDEFYKSLEKRYGTIPDGVRHIFDTIAEVDNERESIVSCLRKEVPNTSKEASIEENRFLVRILVDNLFSKLGTTQPDFMKKKQELVAPPHIPLNCRSRDNLSVKILPN